MRHTVIQPHSVGFIEAKLDNPIEGDFMVTGLSNKKALVANVYGTGTSVTMKVINDSDTFVTFKKGKSIGHAEPAERVVVQPEYNTINQAKHTGTNQTETATQDLPAHLKQMFDDNISNLSESEKLQFKELLIEYQDTFSKDDFDLGCLNSGVEHKINTHDEIPIAENLEGLHSIFKSKNKNILKNF